MICEICRKLDAEFVDSVPDASIRGYSPSECGYRLAPLCWLCAVDRRTVATSRVTEAHFVDGVTYIDDGRACGDARCDVCGKLFWNHPSFTGILGYDGRPFLTLLCGNRVVKL